MNVQSKHRKGNTMYYFEGENAIQALYVAYYGRAAEQDGLNFWYQEFLNGTSIEDIATLFSVQPETLAKYPGLTSDNVDSITDFVNNVYQSLFGRAAEQNGLDYWVNKIVNGLNPGEAILTILGSAQGDDAIAVTNKVQVADSYTYASNVSGEYSSEQSVEILSGVDSTKVSVYDARDSIKDYLITTITETKTVYVDVPVYVDTPHDIDYSVGDLHILSTKNFGGTELWVGTGIYADNKVIAIDHTAGFELAMGANYRTGDQLTGVPESDGVIRIFADAGYQDGTHGENGVNVNRSGISFDYTYQTGVNDVGDNNYTFFLMIDTDPGYDQTNFVEVEFVEVATDKWIGFNTANNVPAIGDDVTYPGIIQDSSNYGFGFLSSEIVGGVGAAGAGDIPAGEYEVYAEVRDTADAVVAKVGIIFDLA